MLCRSSTSHPHWDLLARSRAAWMPQRARFLPHCHTTTWPIAVARLLSTCVSTLTHSVTDLQQDVLYICMSYITCAALPDDEMAYPQCPALWRVRCLSGLCSCLLLMSGLCHACHMGPYRAMPAIYRHRSPACIFLYPLNSLRRLHLPDQSLYAMATRLPMPCLALRAKGNPCASLWFSD